MNELNKRFCENCIQCDYCTWRLDPDNCAMAMDECPCPGFDFEPCRDCELNPCHCTKIDGGYII